MYLDFYRTFDFMLQNALVPWFYPSQQISPAQLLTHSPHSVMGEELEK